MIPGDFELVTVFLPLNSRGADEPGQCSRRVRASREAKDVDFIARRVVGNQEFIGILDDFSSDLIRWHLRDAFALDPHHSLLRRDNGHVA